MTNPTNKEEIYSQEIICKKCSTKKIQEGNLRTLKNDYSEFCDECIEWMQNPTNKEWEERFEKIFCDSGLLFRDPDFANDIKDFIHSLVKKERQAGVKEERESWINQPANKHDEKIRQAEREYVLGEIEIMNQDRPVPDLPMSHFQKLRKNEEDEPQRLTGTAHSLGYNKALEELKEKLRK